MEKKKDILEKLLEVGVFISFSALCITVLLQVFTRFLFPDKSLVWTEEATRFCFIYSIAFAAPLAMKYQEFVNVDIILTKMSKKARKNFYIGINLLTVILFVIVFFQGIDFAKLGIGQRSATMKFSMFISYSSIYLMALGIIKYAASHLIKVLSNKVH